MREQPRVKASNYLLEKFMYFGSVPWLFSRARSADIAKECIEQILRKPISEHEPLTVSFANNYMEDLENVRDGGSGGVDFYAEIGAINGTPLDESPGEGWHRASHLAMSRGACTKLPYMKSSVRLKEHINRLRSFMRTNTKAARCTVRFEWQNAKRILQGGPNFNRPVRLKDREFYNRLYRIGLDSDDWQRVIRGASKPPSGDRDDKANPVSAMRREYMQAVLLPNHHFSIPQTVTEPNDLGEPITVLERKTNDHNNTYTKIPEAGEFPRCAGNFPAPAGKFPATFS